MDFQFGKYTEITDLAFELNPSYKTDGYTRFFICPDTNDYWFIRVMPNINDEYENEEGVFLLERDNIAKTKTDNLTLKKVKEIILQDSGENWDIQQYDSMKELIKDIDGGYGILNLKED